MNHHCCLQLDLAHITEVRKERKMLYNLFMHIFKAALQGQGSVTHFFEAALFY